MTSIPAPLPADFGEEVTDAATPRGCRAFRCPWEDRFAVAHRLMLAFGRVEITGEDVILDGQGLPAGYRFARIEAGSPLR